MTYFCILVLGGLFGYAMRGIGEQMADPDDEQDQSEGQQ